MSRVVQRALAILECFDRERIQLPLGEIAERIKLPKPTAFRLVSTLLDSGYLLQVASGDYTLSPKLMKLAAVAQRNFSIRDIARIELLSVARTTGETVDLSMMSKNARVCIDTIESMHPLKSIIVPGEVLSPFYGASGKALIAYMDLDALDMLLSKSGEGIDRKALLADLRKVRANGYAYSRGERVPGASALAVPLRNHLGEVHYSLAVTGPSFRFDARKSEYIDCLLAAGETISQRLGAARAVSA